ncbi:MAG: S1 RNA-binding domain-containing protein [Candidatus Eisenbacteria sp.]|nr:S1 RNA-binding domain-containing protein [Candidatus Eisenbacteria bacterium]
MSAQESDLREQGSTEEKKTPIAPKDQSEAMSSGAEAPAAPEGAPDTGTSTGTPTAPEGAPDTGTSTGTPTAPEGTPDASAAVQEPATVEGDAPQTHPEPKYKIGQRVWGKVLRLSDTQAVLSLGDHVLDEGTLDLVHLRDDFGNLSLSEGDGLQIYVVRLEPSIKLAPSLFPPAAEVMRKLKEAKENSEVIRGRVTGINRGGLDVSIDGRRAFCPFSQIEIGRCEKPEIYVNHIIDFKVMELDEGKRRIVLSHRAILLKERDEKLHELRSQIKEGAEFEGVVMRLQPFGAFVDIGGIDGLVHISEISYDRLDHPKQALRKGEKVRVKVMGISRGKDDRDRIRLSIKALMEDPWTTLDQHFHQGDIVTGTVTRITEFGAFVKLYPGIEGLLHVSQYEQRGQKGRREPVTAAEKPSEAPPPKTASEQDEKTSAAPTEEAAKAPPASDSATDEAAKATPAPAIEPQSASKEPAESSVPVVGQEITIQISRIDVHRKRISLALRAEEQSGRGRMEHDASVGDKAEGIVRTVKPYGVFLDLPALGPWISGLLPTSESGLGREVTVGNLRKKFPEGERVKVEIIEIDDQHRIRLSRRSLLEAAERNTDRSRTRDSKGNQNLPTAPPGGFNVLAEALRKAQGKDKGKKK